MPIKNSLLDQWAEEAADDLGKKGWRDISTNSLLLIIFKAMKERESRITTPMWWILGVVATGVISFIIRTWFVG